MSDDLERAAKVAATKFGFPTVVPCDREAASAILLSFLDMDEAGKERLARAAYENDAWSTCDDDGGNVRDLPWDDLSLDAREDYLDSARAVLAELRKMAGEKE